MKFQSGSPSSSRRSDVSRLLDPSYASSSSRSYSSQTMIYVDDNGEMHDPDFRQFPTFPVSDRQRGKRPADAFSTPSWDEEEEDSYDASNYRRFPYSMCPASPIHSSPPSSPVSYSSSESWMTRNSSDSFAQKLHKKQNHSSADSRSFCSYQEQEAVEEVAKEEEESTKSAPNTTVKMEWQALQLTVSMGAFRVKRKIRNALK
ncbi:hypothetical protein C8J56DRAFT_1096237 [Mycena floridula]|nr:hypothetical protein C8J56DRAFT_1096237 [Mycena floridula]